MRESFSAVSARIGATAELPPTVLEPAVGGSRPEDDAVHSNRYDVEQDDMFGDGRMVVPPVLGGEPGAHRSDEAK